MQNQSGRKYFRRIPVDKAGESDIHAVCDAFDVSHGLGHAVKKLLMAGKRGSKDIVQDLREAVDCIHREIEFIEAQEGRLVNARTEEQMDHG